MKKNIWIELIGFDKNKRDYGVNAYIKNCLGEKTKGRLQDEIDKRVYR